jgi:hypothetical protein
MRSLAICLLVITATSAGCLRTTAFRCGSDAECGGSGLCEAIGYCSFPNASCTDSGRSFSDSAGQNLSGTCVPATGTPGLDAGVDAAIDGTLGAACPADYAAVAGSLHVYKRILAVTWDQARIACKATSASAYLAVPDDATELVNQDTIAMTAPFWVGIDDVAQPGTFVTQKGVPAVFLPWAPGEPNDGNPAKPQRCVNAISTTQIATDECNKSHVAVCECDP